VLPHFLRLAEKNSTQRPIVINAIRSLRSGNEIIYYTPQVLAEFWNVCTRPASARGGLGLSIDQTERKANLIQKYFTLLHDNVAAFTKVATSCLGFSDKGCAGSRVPN